MRDSIPLLASALAFALTPALFAQQDWFNTWNSPGGSTGDAFGYSVAEMGDLDSDGLSEVLVGAIGADNMAATAAQFSFSTATRAMSFFE